MPEFQRNLYEEIKETAKSTKISYLFGARQVGKTHLLKKLYKNFKKSKYYNLEIPEHNRLFNGTEEEIFNLIKDSGDFVFIDEFRYIKNASKIFKAIYDLGDFDSKQKTKIFASGSSALEMHKHLSESMAGRFKKFNIKPLSVEEFRNLYDTHDDFINYLTYGGLPGVYDSDENPDNKTKQEYLKQIFNTYIQKDVKSLVKEENLSAFNDLIYYLACNQGDILPSSNIAPEVKTTEKTVERYLDILQNTFVLYKIQSFSGNLSNELKKSKKYYFYDLGIRNAILGRFLSPEKAKDKGKIWETYVCLYLMSIINEANTQIKFWRTSDNNLEIDFIYLRDQIPYPIEVKSNIRKPEVPAAFKTFIKSYTNTPFGVVMNEKLDEEIDYKGTKIYFISFKNIEYLREILG